MSDGVQVSYEGIAVVEKSATEVLTVLLDKLSKHSTLKGDAAGRFFFPNGIELISIVVKFGASTGIDVELTVAGEKGVKPAEPSQPSPPSTP